MSAPELVFDSPRMGDLWKQRAFHAHVPEDKRTLTPQMKNLSLKYAQVSADIPVAKLIRGRKIPPPSTRPPRGQRVTPNPRKKLVDSAKHGDCILIPPFQKQGYVVYLMDRGWTFRTERAGKHKLHEPTKFHNGIWDCIYLFFLDPKKLKEGE